MHIRNFPDDIDKADDHRNELGDDGCNACTADAKSKPLDAEQVKPQI